jgi:hypothetical protein
MTLHLLCRGPDAVLCWVLGWVTLSQPSVLSIWCFAGHAHEKAGGAQAEGRCFCLGCTWAVQLACMVGCQRRRSASYLDFESEQAGSIPVHKHLLYYCVHPVVMQRGSGQPPSQTELRLQRVRA